MLSFEYDIRYVKAGVAQLERYLFSKELYWPVDARPPPGGAPYLQLTIGALLLACNRARARVTTPAQQDSLVELCNQITATRSRWLSAWRNKTAHEFRARLALWTNYLEDYRKHPSGHVDRYAYEVSRRVMLALLLPDSEKVNSSELDSLHGLDSLLRACWVPGSFVWEPDLEPSFPAPQYWFLYGSLSITLKADQV